MFPQYSHAAQRRRCAFSSADDRRQPIVEDRQRGPPAERVLLVPGSRVHDDSDGQPLSSVTRMSPNAPSPPGSKRLTQKRRPRSVLSIVSRCTPGRAGEGARPPRPPRGAAQRAWSGSVRYANRVCTGLHQIGVRQLGWITARLLVGRPGPRLRVALVRRPRHVLVDRFAGHVADRFPVELEHHGPVGTQPGPLVGVLGEPVRPALRGTCSRPGTRRPSARPGRCGRTPRPGSCPWPGGAG